MEHRSFIQSLFFYITKIFHLFSVRIIKIPYYKLAYFRLWRNGVIIGKNLKVLGFPLVHLSKNSEVIIGDNCFIRSWVKYSDTGENTPTVIRTKKNGIIRVGSNTGITSTLIFSESQITIGNNVKIGGGTRIFDTNFHSIDANIRNSKDDTKHVKSKPIIIEDNVFIGTGCIITKGVTIGENSIIAAGSVVVKSVPANQVWGGNPAKYIKELK